MIKVVNPETGRSMMFTGKEHNLLVAVTRGTGDLGRLMTRLQKRNALERFMAFAFTPNELASSATLGDGVSTEQAREAIDALFGK